MTPLSPIAFGVALLRRVVAEQSRQTIEDGPMVVLVEDIETMASGLEMAGSALGILPAAAPTTPALLALPAPERKRKRASLRGLSAEEKQRRKLARQREWRAQQKAKKQQAKKQQAEAAT